MEQLQHHRNFTLPLVGAKVVSKRPSFETLMNYPTNLFWCTFIFIYYSSCQYTLVLCGHRFLPLRLSSSLCPSPCCNVDCVVIIAVLVFVCFHGACSLFLRFLLPPSLPHFLLLPRPLCVWAPRCCPWWQHEGTRSEQQIFSQRSIRWFSRLPYSKCGSSSEYALPEAGRVAMADGGQLQHLRHSSYHRSQHVFTLTLPYLMGLLMRLYPNLRSLPIEMLDMITLKKMFLIVVLPNYINSSFRGAPF